MPDESETLNGQDALRQAQDGAGGDQAGESSTPDESGSFEDAITRKLEAEEDAGPEGKSEESEESEESEVPAAEPESSAAGDDLAAQLALRDAKIMELERRLSEPGPARETEREPEPAEEEPPTFYSDTDERIWNELQALKRENRQLRDGLGQVHGVVTQERNAGVVTAFQQKVGELCESAGIELSNDDVKELMKQTSKLGEMPLDRAVETMFRGLFHDRKPKAEPAKAKARPAAVGAGGVSSRVQPVKRAGSLEEAIFENARRAGIS